MKSKALQEKIKLHFPFKATKEQTQLLVDLAEYITTLGNKSIFLLKGYAGTGKTTIVSALVRSLPVLGKRSVLMAPTGRAAKILAKYSKKTINLGKILKEISRTDGQTLERCVSFTSIRIFGPESS